MKSKSHHLCLEIKLAATLIQIGGPVTCNNTWLKKLWMLQLNLGSFLQWCPICRAPKSCSCTERESNDPKPCPSRLQPLALKQQRLWILRVVHDLRVTGSNASWRLTRQKMHCCIETLSYLSLCEGELYAVLLLTPTSSSLPSQNMKFDQNAFSLSTLKLCF